MRIVSTALFLWALILFSGNAAAQSQSSYDSGRGISPAYEGWVLNDDGSYTLLFGYMNENWKQELNVPIGPENSFSPGPAERGHALPRVIGFTPALFIEQPRDGWGEEPRCVVPLGGALRLPLELNLAPNLLGFVQRAGKRERQYEWCQ